MAIHQLFLASLTGLFGFGQLSFGDVSRADNLSIQTFEREVPISEFTLRCRLNLHADGFYEANAFLLTGPEPRSVFSHDSVHIHVSDEDNPSVSAAETCQIIESALVDAQNNGGSLALSIIITLRINYFRSGSSRNQSMT